MSRRSYNESRPDVVLMAVTSQLRATAAQGEVWIVDWQQAGLLKASAIKPVFATVEQTLIVRSLGALQPMDSAALHNAIGAILR